MINCFAPPLKGVWSCYKKNYPLNLSARSTCCGCGVFENILRQFQHIRAHTLICLL